MSTSIGSPQSEGISDEGIDMQNDMVDPLEMITPSMAKANALRQLHPDYSERCKKWDKYSDCYSGEDIYKFLHKHLRESPDMFEIRVNRGYYYNYCASVIDLFVAYLFHSPIARNTEGIDKEEIDLIYADATLTGMKYEAFMELAATFAEIHGHCGVLVDAPLLDEAPESEADRKDQKIRPYLTLVKATQILDWELDRFNKFEWVKIEIKRPQERKWDEPSSTDVRNFLIWNRHTWEEWKLVGDDATKVAEGENTLGAVPLVILRDGIDVDHPWMGRSTITSIADINIAILNWSSLGDEECYERCLNILAMQRDGSDSAPQTLSHHNILEYPPDSTLPPQYLTPGATPLELIGKWIDRAKDEIYRLAKLGGSTGLLGVREATSGIAYAFEFNETNQSLAQKAENLEQGETEIHRLIAKWYGEDFSGTIIYPREFGVDDFLTELQILTEGRMTLSSPTAIKELEKRLCNKLFSRESVTKRTIIEKEIDGQPDRTIAPGVAESFGSVPPGMVQGTPPSDSKSSQPAPSSSADGSGEPAE